MKNEAMARALTELDDELIEQANTRFERKRKSGPAKVYILQSLNTDIFTRPEAVMANISVLEKLFSSPEERLKSASTERFYQTFLLKPFLRRHPLPFRQGLHFRA